MPKINEEEYKILKGLDDKWKFIVRDSDGTLAAGTFCPHKDIRYWKSGIKVNVEWNRLNSVELFQFIQWEDEELYIIAELIEEYEDKPEITVEQAWEVISGKYGEETLINNIEYIKSNGYTVINKPVIPEYVADWIEENKHSTGNIRDLFETLYVHEYMEPPKVDAWVKENFETFTIAYITGEYEIEEEPLYKVIDNHGHVLLMKITKGFGVDDRTYEIATYVRIEEEIDLHLTEQEIKDYDPRYWPFAKPVEEVD